MIPSPRASAQMEKGRGTTDVHSTLAPASTAVPLLDQLSLEQHSCDKLLISPPGEEVAEDLNESIESLLDSGGVDRATSQSALFPNRPNILTTSLFKSGVLDWLMAKSKSRKRQSVEVILAALESIHAQLHDLDQKVDYLIQNFHRYNGDHVHHNARLSDFMD